MSENFDLPAVAVLMKAETRDLILIDNENEELITEEYRILRSEPSYGILWYNGYFYYVIFIFVA